ncbi:MAG: YccF domain-containing protein [Clostridia bacterium]|nr:YccF domain-containing protein [Clostridia bacterium]
MRTIGNILWLIFGGLISTLWWLLAGVLCCVTIVGIPLGKQCFKFARLTWSPFGKQVSYGGGTVSLLANLVWLVFCGVPMAFVDCVMGFVLCVTVVGIPFGIQHFKFAKLDLMPFGASVRKQ